MIGNKSYDLNDPKDRSVLNRMYNRFGAHFETNLLGPYVLVDHDQYQFATKRKAGRKCIINQDLKYKVFSLKSEEKTIRQIAEAAGISTDTVRKILKGYEKEEETDQLKLF